MTATNEQIEDEAHRRFDENPCTPLAHYIIEVTREGWAPPEPVDPDVLAWRRWAVTSGLGYLPSATTAGTWDQSESAIGFLAGARMAREQERERAEVLVEYVDQRALANFDSAIATLAAYKAGRTAR
jgi:hypothetical protein